MLIRMTATFFTRNNEKKSSNAKNSYSLVKKYYKGKVFAIETSIIDQSKAIR